MTTHTWMVRLARIALLTFSLIVLSACTLPKSYVVLLHNDDGSTGKVSVSAKEGTTELAEAGTGAYIGWTQNTPVAFEPAKIDHDFGRALAARPTPPTTFVLYFEQGGATLTPESQALLPALYEELAHRTQPDVSIVGHTDTLGDAQTNEALGLARAQAVAALLVGDKLSAERTSIESHGKRNLLIPTPDNVDEPRNRRVEVTVR